MSFILMDTGLVEYHCCWISLDVILQGRRNSYTLTVCVNFLQHAFSQITSIFGHITFYFLRLGVLTECVLVLLVFLAAGGGQKVFGPLKLDLKTAVFTMWVQETEPGSSIRATNAFTAEPRRQHPFTRL